MGADAQTTWDAVPVVSMSGIVKRFGDLVALAGVDVDLHAGEIHALLGENGAGKTTLMNILSGFLKPDEGSIVIRGTPAVIRSPRAATALRIGIVHQQFRLVRSMTVAENLHIGWSRTPRLAAKPALNRLAQALADQFGLSIDPSARIWQLSVGEQQRVAILRTLAWGAQVIILDEPTAALAPIETRALLQLMRQLARDGRTVVFISHKLTEVLDASDKVTVLRAGHRVATLPISQCDERILARSMVGSDVVLQINRTRHKPGDEVLAVTGVSAYNDRGLMSLRDVSLSVRAGEIVGIVGVAGNGQRELAEVVTGMRRPAQGAVLVEGRQLRSQTLAHIEAGVGHVPENRDQDGLLLDESLVTSAILRTYRKYPIRRRGFFDRRSARVFARGLLERARVTALRPSAPVRHLSGGNRQRLLVQREMEHATKLIVASHPTAGVDVSATRAVWRTLLECRERDLGILLISEDLDEVLSLSDRVLVMYDGRIVGAFAGDRLDREAIGLLMGGASAEAVAPRSAGLAR
jgi:simple sugar transport system ATP-binding protein